MDIEKNKVPHFPEVKFEDGFNAINFFLQLTGFHNVFVEKSEKSQKFQIFQRYELIRLTYFMLNYFFMNKSFILTLYLNVLEFCTLSDIYK